MEFATIATITKLQKLVDERNLIIAQRDEKIERHQLRPHEPLWGWWVTHNGERIREIDERIADVHKQLHREHQSVLEALGLS